MRCKESVPRSFSHKKKTKEKNSSSPSSIIQICSSFRNNPALLPPILLGLQRSVNQLQRPGIRLGCPRNREETLAAVIGIVGAGVDGFAGDGDARLRFATDRGDLGASYFERGNAKKRVVLAKRQDKESRVLLESMGTPTTSNDASNQIARHRQTLRLLILGGNMRPPLPRLRGPPFPRLSSSLPAFIHMMLAPPAFLLSR